VEGCRATQRSVGVMGSLYSRDCGAASIRRGQQRNFTSGNEKNNPFP